MTANEILELVRAGYTKTEIEALNGTQEQEQTQEQTQEQGQEQTQENSAENALAYQVAELAKVVKEMQISNAKSAEGKAPETYDSSDAIKDFFGMKK